MKPADPGSNSAFLYRTIYSYASFSEMIPLKKLKRNKNVLKNEVNCKTVKQYKNNKIQYSQINHDRQNQMQQMQENRIRSILMDILNKHKTASSNITLTAKTPNLPHQPSIKGDRFIFVPIKYNTQ